MRYLSDRRPKVAGALETLHITSAEAHQMPLLSAASKEDLFALPDAPLTALTPEELVRFAQIVDTALFKCYLQVRPGLLAPLCRPRSIGVSAARMASVYVVQFELCG